MSAALPGGLARTGRRLAEAGYGRLADLLWLLPGNVEPAPAPAPFSSMVPGSPFRGAGSVVRFRSRPSFRAGGRARRVPLRTVSLLVRDAFSPDTMELTWFNCYPSAADSLAKCARLVFTGVPRLRAGRLQVSNPERRDLDEGELGALGRGDGGADPGLLVRYPSVNSVPSARVRGVLERIPDRLWGDIPDPLPPDVLGRRGLVPLGEALRVLHGREPGWTGERGRRARERLAYHEFFRDQIRIRLRRDGLRRAPSVRVEVGDGDVRALLDLLPFRLTPDQEAALGDVRRDLASPGPMMRLLQGDVGCGKTAVALLATLLASAAGRQGALMCPTESLALQHFLHFRGLLGGSRFRVGMLLGSTPARGKEETRSLLREGRLDVLVGTHALIQDSVVFRDLAVAVIDEQHKFGVDQRLRLLGKNEGGVHCLVMTATPIPRSLRLTQYGDLDVSTIRTMPPGRRGHRTRIVTPRTHGRFLSFLKTRLSMGEQAYVVVPAIKDDPDLELESVERAFADYAGVFRGHRVDRIHGRLGGDEKRGALERFAAGGSDLLVATSVVEVGIHVPNATVMAVLDPERFGLASLHQLRGRVGRADKPGFCFLVSRRPPAALARLRILEECSDGLAIAEEDLRQRGEGDLFGTHQSGATSKWVVADAIRHQGRLVEAREDVDALARAPGGERRLGLLRREVERGCVLQTV